jgi:hypothetical protein
MGLSICGPPKSVTLVWLPPSAAAIQISRLPERSLTRELPIAVNRNYGAAYLEGDFFDRHSFEHFHLNDRPNGRLDRFQPRENILSIDLFQQLRVTRLQNSSSLVFSRELQRWLDRQTAKHGRSLHVPTRILQVAYLQAGPYLTAIFRLEK